MDQNNNNNRIGKILQVVVVILTLFTAWGGSYMAVKIALAEDRVHINNIQQDVRDLKDDVRELKRINSNMWEEINEHNKRSDR